MAGCSVADSCAPSRSPARPPRPAPESKVVQRAPRCYLSTYHPLCRRAAGREACRQFGHPAYADGSIRREPDLELRSPTISAICHGSKFAPHLRVGDRVIFLTVKGAYEGHSGHHYRLVAMVQVTRRFETHAAAAQWYRARGLRLPSNFVVPANPALGTEHSFKPKKNPRSWDAGYRRRARDHGAFLVCRTIFRNLESPPAVTSKELKGIFGKVPGTRTPKIISEAQYCALVDLAEETHR